MIRRASAVAALALVAACGDGGASADGASGKAGKPKVDPTRVISGVVEAPEGQSLEGANVIACLTPRETCLQEATGSLTLADGVGRYELVVPQAGEYHLMIWKDVNANEAPDVGDIIAFANNMDPVSSGQRLTPMRAFVRAEGEETANLGGNPMGAEADLAAAAQAIQTAGLAGGWSQNSTGSELVWGPEIKF